jgi:predicted Rdx family selenoprotein
MFDIYVDESVIYSNRREGGRLPKTDEIIQRIRDYQAKPARPARGAQSGTKKAPAGGGESRAAAGGDCACG